MIDANKKCTESSTNINQKIMPSTNHYNRVIVKLLNRIAFLQGSLYHINIDLTGFKEYYQKSRSEAKPFDFRLGTHLIIRDISGPTDEGWNYAYPTKQKYIVKLSNYEEYNERLIYEYAAYIIIQSYEAFLQYLKVVLSKYYSNNPKSFYQHKIYRHRMVKSCNSLLQVHRRRNEPLLNESDLMEIIVPGKYGSNFFNSIRKISRHYSEFEDNNNIKIQLNDFHKIFSICRHAITHEESFIRKLSIKKLTSEEIKILEYFAEETNSELYKIKLTYEKTSVILQIICEHAFLIYKSISKKENLNWKVLLKMR